MDSVQARDGATRAAVVLGSGRSAAHGWRTRPPAFVGTAAAPRRGLRRLERERKKEKTKKWSHLVAWQGFSVDEGQALRKNIESQRLQQPNLHTGQPNDGGGPLFRASPGLLDGLPEPDKR